MPTIMTVHIEDDVDDRLDRLAASTRRTKSVLAAEAIRQFVEAQEWQVAEIHAAVMEADAGDFATADEVSALAAKWKVRAD